MTQPTNGDVWKCKVQWPNGNNVFLLLRHNNQWFDIEKLYLLTEGHRSNTITPLNKISHTSIDLNNQDEAPIL